MCIVEKEEAIKKGRVSTSEVQDRVIDKDHMNNNYIKTETFKKKDREKKAVRDCKRFN